MNKKDLVFLNYASAESSVSADSIPTLVPEEKMKSILNGDESPFYKVESIQYPVEGTGGIYQEQFFESFKNVMNDRPIPGSKRGHTWDSRPASDLYTVGAKMDKNGDGTGTIHMKVYIPPEGDSDSNAGLIRDAKANIVHFSLVTWPDSMTSRDEDGNEQTYFTASKGYERNDAVEYGAGAMKQTVNSETGWLDEARALVESGKYNTDDNADKPIQDGVVMRSALRRLVSRPDAENKAEIAELISMIDRNKKGDSTVNKKEILEAVSTATENNSLTLKELAAAMKCENMLITKEHEAALNMANAFAELKVSDPVAEYKNMKDTIDKTEKARVENKLREEFDKQGLGKEKNILFSHALTTLGETAEADLDEAIAVFKEDPVAKNLAGQMADVSSPANAGYSEKGVKNQLTGMPVLEL